ncbi:MAG: AsmA family protein [Proteobacteria bacterium]|nr:AsmA family protein [Pseudomonadota bacterium]
MSTRRNKLFIGIGGAVVLVIVALLIAPSFFDLNKYKPELVSEVKKATGRDLVLDGPVTLSLLPTPAVGVSKVRFFNVAGAKNPNMVDVKAITVKPSLLALLGGNIEVSEVTLLEPKIVLEVNAEGKPNWEFAPSIEGAKPAAAKPSSPKPLSLGRLTIENGTLIFSDSKAGLSIVAEKANFTASVGSFDGPYALAGGATINGAPLKLDLSVGSKGPNGHATSLSLEANGKLGFKGTLSELGPNARLGGVATVSADSLTRFVDTLAGLAGQKAPTLPPLLSGKFSFDGSIDASSTEFAARDFKMLLADNASSGALSVKLKPALAIDAKVLTPKLDLDKVLAAMDASSAPKTAPPPPPATPPAAPRTGTAPAAPPTSLLDGVTAKVSFDIGEVVYNKASVRNVAVELDARGGVVAVPRLAATLPGDMVLQAKSSMAGDPARPTVNGDFSLVGPRLRDTLKWLDVDVSTIPANKLTRLSLKGRMASTSGNVQVTNAAFELDDVKGTGGMVATFSVPFVLSTHVEIDTLDVDSFLPKPEPGKKPAPAAKPAAAAATPKAEIAGPSFGLKLKIAKAIYNKETIGGIDVDLALQGSTLRLTQFDVSNLGGARLAVRGSVTNVTAPSRRPDIAFNFEAPDIDRVLKIAGGTPTGLGRVTASGGLAGTAEQFTLRDVTFVAAADTVKLNGVVAAPGAATGTPSSVGYKGSLSVNGQTVDGTVDVKVADRPMITADLKSSSLDLDKLQSRGPAPARPAAPARGQAASAAAGAQPIDLAGLRSFDASIKFVAGTLIAAPLRISNADLAVTLKNGVLTLQHFKGALYGGALALAGTVDASKPGVAIDFKGDANNISLGDLMRGTHGSNQFGSTVKVTIDGTLSATGITLKGAGATSDQLKSSLAGGTQLGGHVLVGADKALVALTSGAAGAVGGVIDNTLGNVLGAVGQRGLATNILTAASVVLNRFVNRNNPVSGRLEIAGGVLTDKGLAVSGDRATAHINTRTNLVTANTDTTLNLMIAEDPSAPYIIATVRGPASNLSYNVSRGSAKDPPGMVNTLTNSINGGGNSGGGGGGGGGGGIIPKLPIPNIFGR